MSTSQSAATCTDRLGLGPGLRRAWVGYQRRLDDALADAGFGDRSFPDARVLRMCREGGMTIATVGRELRITRQGAAKVVAGLRELGYVRVDPSPTNGREKVITLTPRATEFLAAQRRAARRIERQLQRELGADALVAALRVCDALAPDDDLRLRDYLHEKDRLRR